LTHVIFILDAPNPRTQFKKIARYLLEDGTGLDSVFPNLQCLDLQYSEEVSFEGTDELRNLNLEYLYGSLPLISSLDLKVLKRVPDGLHVKFTCIVPINAIPVGVESIEIFNVCFDDDVERLCFKDWKTSSLRKIEIEAAVLEIYLITGKVSRYEHVSLFIRSLFLELLPPTIEELDVDSSEIEFPISATSTKFPASLKHLRLSYPTIEKIILEYCPRI
jgi:hypothetical protein